MSQELLENKELQALLASLKEGESMEYEGQPLGKYGRMAMRYLHETDRQRFSLLKMTGELMKTMYRVDKEASDMVESITQKLLAKDPLPDTEDILEKTRHFNTKRSIAEELAIHDIVLVAR